MTLFTSAADAAKRFVTDDQIMIAHADGLTAYGEKSNLTDNPHTDRVLRQARHDGWKSAEGVIS